MKFNLLYESFLKELQSNSNMFALIELTMSVKDMSTEQKLLVQNAFHHGNLEVSIENAKVESAKVLTSAFYPNRLTSVASKDDSTKNILRLNVEIKLDSDDFVDIGTDEDIREYVAQYFDIVSINFTSEYSQKLRDANIDKISPDSLSINDETIKFSDDEFF